MADIDPECTTSEVLASPLGLRLVSASWTLHHHLPGAGRALSRRANSQLTTILTAGAAALTARMTDSRINPNMNQTGA
jgi:hypothetical protein